MIGDGNNAAGQIVLLDQMCSSGLSSEPRTSQESLDRGAGASKFAKAGFQFCDEFHHAEYK
jgi:hypothetical protein